MAVILLGIVLWTQYNRFVSDDILSDKISSFYKGSYTIVLSSIILVLVFVNYIIESFKWMIIIEPLEKISFIKSFRSVIVGVLFSIFTPARVGELGGRIIELRDENRLVGSAAVLVGSIAQNIGILFLGLYGLVYLVYILKIANPLVYISILILTGSLLLITLFFYYNIDKFIPLGRKIPWPKRITPYLKKITTLAHYKNTTLTKILILSILRIFGWTIQYALIIHILADSTIGLIHVAIIFMIFLIQTGIPLPPITGVIARSGVAVFMWNQVKIDEWNALTATFVIYFYNLIIPSLVGLFVLLFNRKNLNDNL